MFFIRSSPKLPAQKLSRPANARPPRDVNQNNVPVLQLVDRLDKMIQMQMPPRLGLVLCDRHQKTCIR